MPIRTGWWGPRQAHPTRAMPASGMLVFRQHKHARPAQAQPPGLAGQHPATLQATARSPIISQTTLSAMLDVS